MKVEEIELKATTAIVYSRPGCMKCRVTERKLVQMGVVVEGRQLDDFPEKIELMQEQGWMELPLVEVKIAGGGIVRWGGLSTDNLEALEYVLEGERV